MRTYLILQYCNTELKVAKEKAFVLLRHNIYISCTYIFFVPVCPLSESVIVFTVIPMTRPEEDKQQIPIKCQPEPWFGKTYL